MQTYNVVLDVVKKTALIKLNDKVMSHKMIELSDDMLTSLVLYPQMYLLIKGLKGSL